MSQQDRNEATPKLSAMTTFADLGLSESTLVALRDVGYETPSPIQVQAIPPLLQGRDVIGQAQTGTGKTAAFGLPIIEYVDLSMDEVQGLVLTPTRELCIQVTQALRVYGAHKGVDAVAVFGGAPIRSQEAQLRAGGHIVVGTVGRVLDLSGRGSLQLTDCRFVVLDEADEMLDLGFLEDVEQILNRTPNGRQTALFSATVPPPGQAIVFVRTKIRCDQLFRTLRDRGFNVRALHGDLSQGQRDGVMLAFKGGRVPILVATDVAARGLDISTVTHVINYDVPTSPDPYVHRIGRTGRVGRSGRAITFVEPRQRREMEAIERHIGMKIASWTEGATTAPAVVVAKPRRHDKPHVSRNGDERYARVVASGGRAAGIGVADLVGAVTKATGLDGEAIRDVSVLERFALLAVPESELERVLAAASELTVRGQPLRLEPLRG